MNQNQFPINRPPGQYSQQSGDFDQKRESPTDNAGIQRRIPGYPPYPGNITARRRVILRKNPPKKSALSVINGFLKYGCFFTILSVLLAILVIAVFLLFPGRTNLLVFGIDYSDPGNAVARSDTIMLFTFNPYTPKTALLSIPRDLWVSIPGEGENRINTAHFFAESQQAGSGPQALKDTIEQNFNLNIHYYLRLRFESFREIVDSLGGVDIELNEPMAGYPAGHHHLTGRKALAFVRDRSGTDDFFRMSQGQFMLKSLMKNLLNPVKILRLPAVAKSFFEAIDTNIPIWIFPRLVFSILRTGPDGINNVVLNRELANPMVTDQGAMVLMPNWPLIHLLVNELFNK